MKLTIFKMDEFKEKRQQLFEVEKKLIESEIAMYREKKFFEIDKEVEEYRQEKQKEIHRLALACAKDTKEYEHTFHSSMEVLRAEIAKMEGKRDAMKDSLDKEKACYELIIAHKDAEILRLAEFIKNMSLADSVKAPINVYCK